MLEYLRAHAMPRVADGKHHAIAGPRILDASGGVGIKCDVACLDRENAAIGHSIPRVDRKVEDGIIDIAGIGHGLAGAGRQSQRDGHLLAERSPQEVNCPRDAIVEIHSLEPHPFPARKDEKPASEAGTHLYYIHHVLDHLVDLLVGSCEA